MERKRESFDVSVAAASRISSYVMALVLVLAFALPNLSSASSFFTTKDHIFPEFIKWHIYIVNGLSNSENLFTHCKSTENDLGTNNLPPGSNITWSFRTEFFHSTLFWCYMNKDNASASFEVFWYDARLFSKCNWKNCIWVAKDDGVYLKDLSENHDELRYRWDSGR